MFCWFHMYVCTRSPTRVQPTNRCGQAEQDSEDAAVQTKKSLLEFAQRAWRNKAFEQMTFGMICPGNAFCESAERPPPQNVDAPGALDLLKQVEGILGTYTAVGIVWSFCVVLCPSNSVRSLRQEIRWQKNETATTPATSFSCPRTQSFPPRRGLNKIHAVSIYPEAQRYSTSRCHLILTARHQSIGCTQNSYPDSSCRQYAPACNRSVPTRPPTEDCAGRAR